jgi:hypothetical protein
VAETQTAMLESATSDCSICERSLLVGESLRAYRDRDDRTLHVCELCRDRARKRGLEQLGAVGISRLRVQPSASVSDMLDRDRVIERLTVEVDQLKEQLGQAHLELHAQSGHEDAAHEAADRLHRQERELERLRREQDPVRRAEEHRLLQRQAEELRQLRTHLRQRDEQIARLRLAREAETSPVRMRGFALDAFNSSEHADRMARIARTLDAPEVTVSDEGPAVPRRLRVTLVWDIAWYEFLVKLDLGVGRASVHEVAHGGDPRALPECQRQPNARWRDSGLVLS